MRHIYEACRFLNNEEKVMILEEQSWHLNSNISNSKVILVLSYSNNIHLQTALHEFYECFVENELE